MAPPVQVAFERFCHQFIGPSPLVSRDLSYFNEDGSSSFGATWGSCKQCCGHSSKLPISSRAKFHSNVASSLLKSDVDPRFETLQNIKDFDHEQYVTDDDILGNEIPDYGGQSTPSQMSFQQIGNCDQNCSMATATSLIDEKLRCGFSGSQEDSLIPFISDEHCNNLDSSMLSNRTLNVDNTMHVDTEFPEGTAPFEVLPIVLDSLNRSQLSVPDLPPRPDSNCSAMSVSFIFPEPKITDEVVGDPSRPTNLDETSKCSVSGSSDNSTASSLITRNYVEFNNKVLSLSDLSDYPVPLKDPGKKTYSKFLQQRGRIISDCHDEVRDQIYEEKKVGVSAQSDHVAKPSSQRHPRVSLADSDVGKSSPSKAFDHKKDRPTKEVKSSINKFDNLFSRIFSKSGASKKKIMNAVLPTAASTPISPTASCLPTTPGSPSKLLPTNEDDAANNNNNNNNKNNNNTRTSNKQRRASVNKQKNRRRRRNTSNTY